MYLVSSDIGNHQSVGLRSTVVVILQTGPTSSDTGVREFDVAPIGGGSGSRTAIRVKLKLTSTCCTGKIPRIMPYSHNDVRRVTTNFEVVNVARIHLHGRRIYGTIIGSGTLY